MKKLLFTLATVATIFATSCKKENINPATDVLDGEFIATIENNMTQDAPGVNDNMGTKTALVNGKYITWQNGDKITINGVEYEATAQSGAQASFNISGQGSVGAAPYHAFYPATIQKQGSGNYDKGTLPAEQRFNTARDANGNPIISNIPIYAYSASHSLTFHNIFAVLQIEMPYDVDSFKISSASKVMNGDFTINNSGYAGMDGTGTSTITVKPLADNEVFGESTTVYVAIPAQKYTEFTFNFTTNNVTKTVSKSFAEKDFKINRLYTIKFSSQKPFYFEALHAGSTVWMDANIPGTYEYSSNPDATTWTTLTKGDANAITLTNEGDRVYIRATGTNDRVSNTVSTYAFHGTGQLKVSGNIMYLLNGTTPATTLVNGTGTEQNSRAFMCLFGCNTSKTGNTALVDASGLLLPATSLSDQCYQYMFSNCTNLTKAPSSLPATTLAKSCYTNMFQNCSNLVDIPKILPATTLPDNCYNRMFYNCIKIETAPSMTVSSLTTDGYQCSSMFKLCEKLNNVSGIHLNEMSLAKNCYSEMFNGCKELTSSPELPATTLAQWCYSYMFENCNKLASAPELPAETLAIQCYFRMFWGCSKISSVVLGAKYGFDTVSSGAYPLSNWLGVASNSSSVAGKDVSGNKYVYCTTEASSISSTYFPLPTGWSKATATPPAN